MGEIWVEESQRIVNPFGKLALEDYFVDMGDGVWWCGTGAGAIDLG